MKVPLYNSSQCLFTFFVLSLNRCSLIEPGPVSTSFVANLSHTAASDDSLLDEETKQLYDNYSKKMRAAFTTVVQTPDEVSQVIMEALLAEKPHLRYQTNKNYAAATSSKLADSTGDASVELMYQRFFN